jgi:sporulation protein YlmC with PRC-barrel domain
MNTRVADLVHMPCRVAGESRATALVDRVLVSPLDLAVQGFLLTPRLFWRDFLPASPLVHMTATGLEIAHRQLIERRPRRCLVAQPDWLRQVTGQPVWDADGQQVGRVSDALVDAERLCVTHVIVSRGVIGDLLSGALVINVERLEFIQGRIKVKGFGKA